MLSQQLYLVAPTPAAPRDRLLGCRWRPSPRTAFSAYVVAFDELEAAETVAREVDPYRPIRVVRAPPAGQPAPSPRRNTTPAGQGRLLVTLPLRSARVRGKHSGLEAVAADLDDTLAVLPLELNLGVVLANGPAEQRNSQQHGRLLVFRADVYAPARDVDAFRCGLARAAAHGL